MDTLVNVTMKNAGKTSISSPPLKVCMHVLTTGRTDNRVLREAAALVEAGYDVSIVDVEPEHNRPTIEDFQGIQLKHIVNPAWFTRSRFKPLFFVKMGWMIFRAALLMLRTPADIYHAHDENALPACYFVARLRRKPLIFDAHELPLENNPNFTRWRRLTALAKRLLAAALPYCAGIITTSSPYAQAIQEQYHRSDITLVRNFPVYQAVKKSDRLRKHLGIHHQVRIALYQGYLQPSRGLDRLVQAASFLKPDIVIIMMGPDQDNTKGQLEALSIEKGVADRIKIIPAVPYEELLDWTASADVGLNILATEYSLSMIKPLDVGRIVPSFEPETISSTINEILADNDALMRMHRNALEAARKELNWEKEKEQLITLYSRVFGRQNQEQVKRLL